MATALITGASSGIGLALARVFAADGIDVILSARSEDKLHALAKEVREKIPRKGAGDRGGFVSAGRGAENL